MKTPEDIAREAADTAVTLMDAGGGTHVCLSGLPLTHAPSPDVRLALRGVIAAAIRLHAAQSPVAGSPLSDGRLAEIVRLEQAATPGPWRWVTRGSNYGGDLAPPGGDDDELVGPDGERIHSDGSAGGEYGADIDVHGPDAAFIAAARTAVPELLAHIDYLHAIMGDDLCRDALRAEREAGRRWAALAQREACVGAAESEMSGWIPASTAMRCVVEAVGRTPLVTEDRP